MGSDAGVRFLRRTTVPGFLVLSLVRSKQVHYPLPLFPALALMLARSAERMD